MFGSEFPINGSNIVARLDGALGLSRIDHTRIQTAQDGFVRDLNNFHAAQGNLSARIARQLNKHTPLFRLTVDILHVLVHHIETSATFDSFRQTSSVLRQLIDQTGFVACNETAGSPPCRHVQCANSFTASVVLRQRSKLYDELQQRLSSVTRVTLQLPSGGLRPLPGLNSQRWARICAALNQPAPCLQDIVLWNTTVTRLQETPPRIPFDIFAGFAPNLKTATIRSIGLPLQFEHLRTVSAFASLTSLDYNPLGGRMSRAELSDLLAALLQLTTLALRLILMTGAKTGLAPIPHRLQALRIDYLQRGHGDVYHVLCKHSTTLRRFEARLRLTSWWHYLNVPPSQYRELAAGLDITELDVASPGSGLEKLRFYHQGGPEMQLLAMNVSLLTKLTLHQLLWPEQSPPSVAPCLTDMHLIMAQCDAVVTGRFAASTPDVQDIFLAGKETAWRVPALKTFSLSYAATKSAGCHTSWNHMYCPQGRMLMSADLIVKTISELFIFERERLDEIRLSHIELYEVESTAVSMLTLISRDVVQTSQSVGSVATMHVPRRLPPLKM